MVLDESTWRWCEKFCLWIFFGNLSWVEMVEPGFVERTDVEQNCNDRQGLHLSILYMNVVPTLLL